MYELDDQFEGQSAPDEGEQLAAMAAGGLGLGALVVLIGALRRSAGAMIYWAALGVAGPIVTLVLWLRRRLRQYERAARRAGALAAGRRDNDVG